MRIINRRGDTVSTLAYHALSNRVVADSGPSIAVYGGGNSRPTVDLQPMAARFVPYDTALFTPPQTDTVAATVTDAGGHSSRFTVNAVGQALTTTGVLNDTLRVTYNSALLADSVIPRWGPRSGYRYDGAGLDTLATAEGLRTHLMYRHGFCGRGHDLGRCNTLPKVDCRHARRGNFGLTCP